MVMLVGRGRVTGTVDGGDKKGKGMGKGKGMEKCRGGMSSRRVVRRIVVVCRVGKISGGVLR